MLSSHKSRRCSFDHPGKCDRESKHYVNCPLDYDTKMRLQRAAPENEVKMTVIMKAAIDQFLTLKARDGAAARQLLEQHLRRKRMRS